MKKSILTALAFAGASLYSYGQGAITFDSTEGTPPPAYNVTINSVVDSTQDINAELLYYNGTSFVPLVTLLLDNANQTPGTYASPVTLGAAGDVSDFGLLYDASGSLYQVPSNPANTVVTFEVEGWLGNGIDSYAAATTKGVTASFTDAVTSTSSFPNANIDNMPVLNLTSVPEPATFALAGLGLASLLAFRRRS